MQLQGPFGCLNQSPDTIDSIILACITQHNLHRNWNPPIARQAIDHEDEHNQLQPGEWALTVVRNCNLVVRNVLDMKYLLPLLIVINCQTIQVVGDFEWTVIGKATDYGQNVTLFCNVSNCCPKHSGWDRWTPVQRTLFIDVKTGRPNKKYEGKVFKDGYTLIIKNLTKHDLNVSYSCLYGATLGKRKYLLEEDIFTYISTTEPNGPSDISILSDGEIAGIIVGVIVIVSVTIVVFLILFWRHRNLRKERDNGTDEVVSLIDYFLQDPVNVDCIEGGDAMLTCKVRADSPPAKWLKGSKEINPNENYIISKVATQQGLDFQLTLKKIKRSDSGDYCVKVGKFVRTLKLKVIEIPREINDVEKNIYMEAIKSGTEVRKFVRIQVIGKDRVGKTSLVRRLLGYDKHDGTSTDGIEIDRNCQIRTSDGVWIVGKEKKEKIKRILQIVNQKEKEPVSHQLLPQKPLPSQENILENGKESYNKEPNRPKHHLQDTEQIEKCPSQKIGTNNSIKHATDTVNLSSENNDKSEKREAKEQVQMSDSSFISRKNENPEHPEEDDKINELLIKEMNKILLGAKTMQTEKDNTTSEDLVECGIWDFAGQKDYYATHQTFFTAHAIYLLVTDIEDIEKDMKSTKEDNDVNFDNIGDYIDFWFDSIHCLCLDQSPDKLCPPVIMVCTGMDKCLDQEVKKREKDYEDNFLHTFGRQEKVRHRRGIHFISNKNPSEGEIERLKKHISNIAKEMKYFAEKLPARWIKLENALNVLKDMTRTICSWNNIKRLADDNSIPVEELILFLKYQHKIGNIIFFEDKRDSIILQPNWLVKCFRCLVCDDNKQHGGSALDTEMCNLKQEGRLSEKLINALFDKESDLNFGKYKDHILDVMGKFDIILEQECIDTNKKSYYMPCMIKQSSALEDVIKNNLNFKDPHRSAWLTLEFKFLPIAYFNHILVNYIRNNRVYTSKSGHPVIYTGKTIVHLDETFYNLLIICFSKNAISLQIYSAEHQIDIDANDKTYALILRNLCSEIEKLERTLMHTLSYKITAKCSTGDYDSITGRISIDELNTKSDNGRYFCKEHGDFHSTEDIENTWLKHAATVSFVFSCFLRYFEKLIIGIYESKLK
ncbi:unnamed protein product [Mytilus coruscus]|uniref:Ig-like domain-containing protein n=1 Tax=Mytilus coruscus TaxID=42192 RepID=A0A6J7ZRA1_MYTCO|nr:unnamed protein product [Mytilus coruscus]